MVKTFQAYLPSCHRTYSCIHCRAHLANHDELISKSFQGSQGRAYLFNSVVNVGCGPAEERVLLTGLHAVADIYCECCKTTLGWKYEHAFESSQKYKEGKFIIELAHMIKENGWEWKAEGNRRVPCASHQTFPDDAYNVVLIAMYGPSLFEPPTKVCDFICDL